jgi:uncharacterized protein
MKRAMLTWGWVCSTACLAPSLALAAGPAFNCAQVQSEVEKLVCSDAALAARDRSLTLWRVGAPGPGRPCS